MSPTHVLHCIYRRLYFCLSTCILKSLKIVTCLQLTLICFLIITLNSSANASNCIHEGCDCKFISNRKSASCINLNLNQLPKCSNLPLIDINSLQEIKTVNLTQNYFPELTNEFFHAACLDNLQKIYIQQAGIKKVHDQAFQPLKNIIELSLSLNSLKHIPSKAIDELTNLRYLDLSFNNFRYLSNDSFKHLSNLRTLLLNNNEIDFIDIDSFNGLTTIEIIKLDSNQLVTLQPEIFINLRALHSLYLENNNWSCNCTMQPFKRMLLLKPNIKVHDNPRCFYKMNSVTWNNLENFQCSPNIFKNFSDTDITISEGSKLKLKCAIFMETFGDATLDEEYLSYTQIAWNWNNLLITNNSRGCDHKCKPNDNNEDSQQFQISEYVREYNNRLKLKISILELHSIMTINEGNYICNSTNRVGSDELAYQVHVIPYYSSNNFNNDGSKISPAASSDSQVLSYSNDKNKNSTESNDHILFGLVLGILCGIFIVLVIFSVILVVFFRKHKVAHQPQELVIVDASTDNNTVDENQECQTETTEKMNVSQIEFNPLLVVNPVQKPPRLGIPDVSSIYSNPSWTMDRANYNRSRYASYAETEPLYSDYYTLYRSNRHVSRLDNRTFISDTASEV